MIKSLLIIAFFVVLSFAGFSQITLKAIITSADGIPFPGVTVSIKGSKAAPVSSNTCGEFQITIPQDYQGVLVLQCINAKTYEIELSKLKDKKDCILSVSDIRKFENKQCAKKYKEKRRITL